MANPPGLIVLRVLEARGPDWSNSLVAARDDRAQLLRSHPRRLVLVACSAVPLQARSGGAEGTLCSLFLSVIFVQFEIDGYIGGHRPGNHRFFCVFIESPREDRPSRRSTALAARLV